MAFKVLFYDAVNGSPSYNSEDFANYFKQFSSDGILGSTGGECAVTAISGSRKVKIAKGCALLDGRQVIIDDNGVELAVPQNSVTNYVVIEQTITTGLIEPKIVQSITTDGRKYIQLATVQTSTAAANISSSDITDKRVFAEFNLKNQKSGQKEIVFASLEGVTASNQNPATLKIAKPAINHNYVKARVELFCPDYSEDDTSSFLTDIVLDRTGNGFKFVSDEGGTVYHTLCEEVLYYKLDEHDVWLKETVNGRPGYCNIVTILPSESKNMLYALFVLLEEDGEFYNITIKPTLSKNVQLHITATVEFE